MQLSMTCLLPPPHERWSLCEQAHNAPGSTHVRPALTCLHISSSALASFSHSVHEPLSASAQAAYLSRGKNFHPYEAEYMAQVNTIQRYVARHHGLPLIDYEVILRQVCAPRTAENFCQTALSVLRSCILIMRRMFLRPFLPGAWQNASQDSHAVRALANAPGLCVPTLFMSGVQQVPASHVRSACVPAPCRYQSARPSWTTAGTFNPIF